jgi:hypothetical protein
MGQPGAPPFINMEHPSHSERGGMKQTRGTQIELSRLERLPAAQPGAETQAWLPVDP